MTTAPSLPLYPTLRSNIIIVQSRLLILSLPNVYFFVTKKRRKSDTAAGHLSVFTDFMMNRRIRAGPLLVQTL
jgi:hypothetical protein